MNQVVTTTLTYWHPTGDSRSPYSRPQIVQGVLVDDFSEVEFSEPVLEGGYLFIGEMSEFVDPRQLPEAREIVSVGQRPCLRTLAKKYTAFTY